MVISDPGPVLADLKSAKAAQQGKKRLHVRAQREKVQYHQKRAYVCVNVPGFSIVPYLGRR